MHSHWRNHSHEGKPNAEGAWAQEVEAELPTKRLAEEIERGLKFGLEAAPSIIDRGISTFVRGELPHFAGETGTFLKCPFMEDVHDLHDAEVAILGAPLDTGTTYRPGTRFGPQGIRRATNLFGTYSYEYGVDLREQVNMVDIGDVFVIPANLEKSFDQISRAMSFVVEQGVFPVILGGDHSIGYPTIRGLARILTAISGSSTSTATSTRRRPISTSACTPPRGSTPPTCPTPPR
jgi:agmatinase